MISTEPDRRRCASAGVAADCLAVGQFDATRLAVKRRQVSRVVRRPSFRPIPLMDAGEIHLRIKFI